jgi:hypothetical protein
MEAWSKLTASGHGEVAGPCKHGNEPSGYIEWGKRLLASQEGLCSKELVSLFLVKHIKRIGRWLPFHRQAEKT